MYKYRVREVSVCGETWYDDAGVFGSPLHGLVGGVGHGEQVRGVLVELPPPVGINGVSAIDVHLSVGVHGDHHFSDVGVDAALLKPVHTEGGGGGLVFVTFESLCFSFIDLFFFFFASAIILETSTKHSANTSG